MDERVCPIILAGLLAKESPTNNHKQRAACLGTDCAWWNAKYSLCLVEMIALRA